MKNKRRKPVVFLNSEGLPFGHSAEKNKNKMVARMLDKEGFDVYSVHKIIPEDERRVGFSNGVRFIFLNAKPRKGFLKLTYFIRNLYKEFSIIKKTRCKIDKDIKCFLIIAYSPFILVIYYKLVSKLLNLKLIISIMEWHVAIPSKNNFQKFNKFLFDYYSFALANGAIPITNFIDKKIKNKYPNTKTYILPAITDYEFFNRIKEKNSISKGKTALYCGNLGYFEVIEFIVESFGKAHVSNSKLTLIISGSAEQKNKLNNYLKGKDLQNIYTLSDLSFEELVAEYKTADALLIPLRDTPQDNARFPHKISEYVASRTPIITTNVGVIRNYFNTESAYISDKYEVSSFAEQIVKCLETDNKALVAKAYETGLQNFNYEAHKTKFNNFLLEI